MANDNIVHIQPWDGADVEIDPDMVLREAMGRIKKCCVVVGYDEDGHLLTATSSGLIPTVFILELAKVQLLTDDD